MLLDFLGKHSGVQCWMSDKERLSVAGGEDWLRLLDSDLSSGDLTGISSDEVVHRLLAGEFGNCWEHSVGVSGEEDDVLRVPGD